VHRIRRSLLILIGVVQTVFAVALLLRLPFATRLWPFPGTTPLTLMLVASFFAAAAASTLWAVATENYAAFGGIALDYVAIFGPLAVFSWRLSALAGGASFTVFAVASTLGALFGLALLLWSLRRLFEGDLLMPGPVRGSFVVFVVVLVGVAALLIAGVPNVIPWRITPELSVVMGWMFLGAATYFAYGLSRPLWVNAAGQLAGFLAYDLVLILPLVTRLSSVAPEHRIGLIVYTVVVAYSGLLAVYYLFVHPPTRRGAWRRAGTAAGSISSRLA